MEDYIQNEYLTQDIEILFFMEGNYSYYIDPSFSNFTIKS
jgi:hypothetical protein